MAAASGADPPHPTMSAKAAPPLILAACEADQHHLQRLGDGLGGLAMGLAAGIHDEFFCLVLNLSSEADT